MFSLLILQPTDDYQCHNKNSRFGVYLFQQTPHKKFFSISTYIPLSVTPEIIPINLFPNLSFIKTVCINLTVCLSAFVASFSFWVDRKKFYPFLLYLVYFFLFKIEDNSLWQIMSGYLLIGEVNANSA